jgi:hypothetical protein
MRNIASRLRYSIEKPPDVMELLKVCAEMGDYLEDVKSNLPVDSLVSLSKSVDKAIRRMKDLRLTGEFAEAKFRRVIAQFFTLCKNLKRAPSGGRAISRRCPTGSRRRECRSWTQIHSVSRPRGVRDRCY